MWPPMAMRFEGCRDVATEVDQIGGDVAMLPLKLMRFEGFRDVATDGDGIRGVS